ncbi:MAG: maleylacetoacetate isomerase [Aestuariivita sp.]|nr:maleylacetoacetate isomerase [Aestuariivita sp.]
MTEAILHDYWRSSASYRCRIALNLAEIRYTSVQVDLLSKQNRLPDHLGRNPQGLVPVLEIDGHTITQSLAIIEYLDATRGLKFLPKSPIAQAKVRALAYAIAMEIHPVCNLQVAEFAVEITGTEESRGRWMQRFMRPGLEAVEKMLSNYSEGPYACGPSPSLVDLCLVPQIYNARRWNVKIDDLGKILSAVHACDRHTAFQTAYPEKPIKTSRNIYPTKMTPLSS